MRVVIETDFSGSSYFPYMTFIVNAFSEDFKILIIPWNFSSLANFKVF